MAHPLTGAAVLVAGGTGSFGQAFTRRLLAELGPRKIVILSRDELKQFEMRRAFGDDARLRFLLGDICHDPVRLARACDGIEYVVHAAAIKQVPACERNPHAAANVNVNGCINLANACVAAQVQRAVFLSTDKAVSPGTAYGAFKLAGEMLWTLGGSQYGALHGTRFAATRYGNVLASRGSVLPLWADQVAAGVPITLTDPHMTRFWMTLDDAVDLVLEAFRVMRGGEVVVPKIGAASMADLAAALYPGWPVRVVGLRSREKLHEALVAPEEAHDCFDVGACYVIEPPHHDWEDRRPDPVGERCIGLVYGSDTAPRLSAARLRAMAGVAVVEAA